LDEGCGLVILIVLAFGAAMAVLAALSAAGVIHVII
jgi:hypothetical protein